MFSYLNFYSTTPLIAQVVERSGLLFGLAAPTTSSIKGSLTSLNRKGGFLRNRNLLIKSKNPIKSFNQWAPLFGRVSALNWTLKGLGSLPNPTSPSRPLFTHLYFLRNETLFTRPQLRLSTPYKRLSPTIQG